MALAHNGQEELERVKALTPDIIVTDVMMPVKTSFEVVQELRQIEEFKNLPIIAVSASVIDLDCEKSRIASCNDLLAKPINEQQLFQILEKHLCVEWEYETAEEATQRKAACQQSEDAALVVPPQDQLEAFYDLAMLGIMNDIITKADEIEAFNGGRYKPFTHKIKAWAEDFADEEILAFLEHYLRT